MCTTNALATLMATLIAFHGIELASASSREDIEAGSRNKIDLVPGIYPLWMPLHFVHERVEKFRKPKPIQTKLGYDDRGPSPLSSEPPVPVQRPLRQLSLRNGLLDPIPPRGRSGRRPGTMVQLTAGGGGFQLVHRASSAGQFQVRFHGRAMKDSSEKCVSETSAGLVRGWNGMLPGRHGELHLAVRDCGEQWLVVSWEGRNM